MANLEIDVPDDLHERMRRVAGADDSAVNELALTAIRRELDLLEWMERWAKRPVRVDTAGAAQVEGEAQSGGDKSVGKGRRELSMAEWQARRKGRPTLHTDFDAAAAIREERERREQEWHSYLESRQQNTS